MFRKLKRKTAIYHVSVIVIVLAVLFSVSCIINYERLNSEIDENLTMVERMGGAEKAFNDKGIRYGFIIRLYNDRPYKLSDTTFYDDATITKILTNINKDKAKINIDGKRIAYSVKSYDETHIDKDIYIYDYTKDYNSFIKNLITLLAMGLAITISVSFFITFFTYKTLKPIEEAFAKQEELVANASHELKTPLAIINTDLAVLQETDENAVTERKKWINGIGTQVARMSDLINEMLLLAKIDAPQKTETTRVNFSEIVEKVVLETEVLAFEKNIELDSEIKKNIEVQARQADMEKLVYILVENAEKYTEPKGKITVSLTSEKRKAVLRVKNTGEGIPANMLPKLFDRFYRVDEAHTTTGSFGLGLAIAKAICNANNCAIGVNSKEGEYTEFVVAIREI